MKNNLLISVIVTVYNTEKYLRQCLDSIVSQSYTNLEIIIVNDGSTDNSLQICLEYSDRFDNVKIINKENGGASDARNCGLKAAQGEYIHYIDSDDFLIDKNLYQNLINRIDCNNPNIIFSLYKGYSAMSLEEIESQQKYNRDGFYDDNILLHVLEQGYIMTLTCPVNKLFNRKFLLKNNLFFTVGLDHEEDEWLPRVISCVDNAFFYNEYIYGVRCRREGSLSENKSDAVLARKARSKMKIAATGMEFMKDNISDGLTLKYVAGYYWEYMMSAVINTQKLKDKNLRRENFNYIKSKKEFFKNYKLLLNKNWRIMGLMFRVLGIKFTAKILAKRYAKF